MNTRSYYDTNTKPRRPLPVPAPVRNPITLFLFWASKTDPRLAAVCSNCARSTQAAFGVFVCFTTAMAFCAAYYTLYTLGVVAPWTEWVAAAYSIFLMVLEREIVGGIDKATAWIRLLLALIIGTIISVPVELRVFESRVNQELARQYRQDNKDQLEELRAEAGLKRSAAFCGPRLPIFGNRRRLGGT
jgi:hypothetical protein